MIYYFTFGPAIAAVEDAGQAAKYADAGWERVSPEAYRAAWRDKDRRALAAQLTLLQNAPLSRAVGGAPGGPEQVAGLPIGMVKQWVDGR